jgi:phage shock protein A
MTSKQPVQGILSVKELTSELEKTKRNEVLLKTRIRSLETEVETLRARLDSLRKAKNTTIIKRERDQPLVPLSPKLGQKGECGLA